MIPIDYVWIYENVRWNVSVEVFSAQQRCAGCGTGVNDYCSVLAVTYHVDWLDKRRVAPSTQYTTGDSQVRLSCCFCSYLTRWRSMLHGRKEQQRSKVKSCWSCWSQRHNPIDMMGAVMSEVEWSRVESQWIMKAGQEHLQRRWKHSIMNLSACELESDPPRFFTLLSTQQITILYFQPY